VSLAVIGHLSRDVIADGPPRIGGGPWHAGRALRALGADARIVAKCGEEDAAAFRRELESLELPFDLAVGERTTAFSMSYDAEGVRTMRLESVGDPWRREEVRLEGVEWVHAAPILRGELDVALVADRRRVLLDGHGLVRVPEPGPLRLDAAYDRNALRHVSMLKLAVEEAEVVGDVDVSEVVVTHGPRGATVNGVSVECRAVDRDPTGAGDMFGAAYLVARAAGRGPVDAARAAAELVSDLLA
jgi:sugar/nucleoside kinase (ribokinase family)